MKLSSMSAAIALHIVSLGAVAAEIDSTHLPIMYEQADRFGYAAVTVVLPQPHPDEARKNPESFASQTREKAAIVLSELGANAKNGGRYISPLGSMDIWVTREGLATLRASKNAIKVIIGPDWHHKTLLPKTDGSVDAINKLLDNNSSVDVEVTLNIDGAAFDVDRHSGRASLLIDSESKIRAARSTAASLLSSLGVASTSPGARDANNNIVVVSTDEAEKKGFVIVKTNRLGLFDLARRTEVRAIKPVGYSEDTAPSVDSAAIDEGSKAGKIGVIVQLRSPYAGGKMSTASIEAQRSTYQRMLSDFLAPYKMLREVQEYPDFGAAGIVISNDDFKKLISTGDRRLQGVLANKPQYKLSLATSTKATNVQGYWDAGVTASGQVIAILDSGILKSHAMLQNATGGSKIITESC